VHKLRSVLVDLLIRYSDWSFRSVFDRVISRSCPAADYSAVEVSQTEGGDLLDLSPSPLVPEHVDRMNAYDITRMRGELNLVMTWPEERFDYASGPNVEPTLRARRSLKGSLPLEELVTIITNDGDVARSLLYVETLPWFIDVYLHTLAAEVNGTVRSDVVQSISYVPPKSPEPTVLEVVLVIPPQSIVKLTLTVERAFIRYTEHPPDAHRGWDLPAAVLFSLDGLAPKRMYTPTLLVDLPTPDFSMPYNVIIMTSTLVALFFGSVFNLLTRKFVLIPPRKKNEVDQTGT